MTLSPITMIVWMRVSLIHALPTVVSQAKVFFGPFFHSLESGVAFFTLGSAIALRFWINVVRLLVAVFVVDFHSGFRLSCSLVFVTLALFLLGHLSLLVLLLHWLVQVAVVIVLGVESFRWKTLMVSSFFVLLRFKVVWFFSLLRSYTLNEWFIIWFSLWIAIFFVFFRNLFEIVAVIWVLGLSLRVDLLFLTWSTMVVGLGVSVLLFLVYYSLLFATLTRVPRLLIRWLHLSLTILFLLVLILLSLLMLANFTAFPLLWLLLLWHAWSASSGNLVFLPKSLVHISVLAISSVFCRSTLREGKLLGLVILTLFIVTFLIRLIRVTMNLLSASRRISNFHLSHFSLQYSLGFINFLSLTLFLLTLRTVVLFV